MVIHNHPYYGASHSPDIAIVIPIFFEAELVGFSANTAHHVDIGAATPGLIIDIPDVFAEGMLFAGIKLYEKGKRNEGLWQFIGHNSRTARQLKDDLDAQIASAQLGVRRFQELMTSYGKETVQAAANQLMDYTESIMRNRISEIPDGDYTAEGFLDDDGRNRGKRLPVKVTVRVRGDGVTVDLTGSADQVPTGYNVPFEGSTKVACYCAFRALLLDAETAEVPIPSNQGSFRPIEVVAPKGSIFNPAFPAAAEARFTQCNMMIDLILKALSPVVAHRVTAGNSASLSFVAYSWAPALGGLLGVPRSQRRRLWRAAALRRTRLHRQFDVQHAQQPDRGFGHAPAHGPATAMSCATMSCPAPASTAAASASSRPSAS